METKENIKKPKAAGGVRVLQLDLDQPKFKDMNLEMNNLSIFVGANGVGKSFVLAASWAMCYIQAALVISKKNGMSFDVKELATFTIKGTFNHKEMTGTMGAIFDSGATINITLKEGVATDGYYTGFDDITEPTPAIYLSAAMRRFESMNYYLADRREKSQGKSEMEVLVSMLDRYKLYDVMYIEQLIKKCPIEIKKGDIPILEEMMRYPGRAKSFNVDLNKGEFYVLCETEEGDKYWPTTQMGGGEQAILNMGVAMLK